MAGTITIRLPEELEKELDTVTREEKASRSEVIREAIARHLAIKRFKQLRRHVMPFAEAQGILTDEDVFKIVS
jgi:metal-responsive CopG/Arc/MetJ family transcriptional regulator